MQLYESRRENLNFEDKKNFKTSPYALTEINMTSKHEIRCPNDQDYTRWPNRNILSIFNINILK